MDYRCGDCVGWRYPSTPILVIAVLYSIGAHGIMTLNDQHRRRFADGHPLAPRSLGRERAAKVACVHAVTATGGHCLLLQWQLAPYATAVTAVVVAQCLAMKRLLSDPKQLAPWYNATAYRSSARQMSAAVGLGGWFA